MSPGPTTLRILGGIDLCGPDGRPVRSVLAQPKRLAILIYLASGARGLHRRDTLFAMFWPEADAAKARGALNRAVYFLRQNLGHDLILTHGDEEVGLDIERVSCDAVEFEAALTRGEPEAALALYRGDLAPGFLVAESPGFERWLEGERSRLAHRALDAALGLARNDASPGGLDRAERWAERATLLAPFDERAARVRMVLLDRLGDRAGALRVFDDLQRRLLNELEVGPSPESLELVAAIRSRVATGREPPVPSIAASPAPPTRPLQVSRVASGSRGRHAGLGLLFLGAVLLGLVGLLGLRAALRRPIPLLTGRWTQITADEGVEFEPALSPNGSEVAYATRREGRMVIAVRSAAGGTSGELILAPRIPGNQGLPSWSADGERIRFTTREENHPDAAWWEVGRLGGTPHPLPLPRQSRWIAWSRDDQRLLLVTQDSFLVTDRRVPTPRMLPWPAGLSSPHSPAWSPDERWVALVDQNPLWPTGRNTAGAALWLLDPATGRALPVADARQLNVSPVWLDPHTLLFISDRDGLRELYAVRIGAEGPEGAARKLAGATGAHSVAIAAGGSRLGLSRMEVRTELRRFALQAAGVLSLASGTTLVNGNQVIESHDVSLDGRWLLFDSNRGGNADLYRLRLDSAAEPIPVDSHAGDQFFPQLSPDGATIAYYGGPDEFAIWLVPAEGGTALRVSESTEKPSNPRWAPDGLSLAYTGEGHSGADVWVRSRADRAAPWGPAQRLTGFGCYLATWTSSGDGIICRTNDARSLVLVARDGTIRWRRDLTAMGFSRNPMVVAARGDSALYFLGTRGADIGIWAWYPDGDPPRLVLRADDPSLDLLGHPGSLTVTHGQLVVTVGRMESDIWVTDLH